jgi:hypothetical protein
MTSLPAPLHMLTSFQEYIQPADNLVHFVHVREGNFEDALVSFCYYSQRYLQISNLIAYGNGSCLKHESSGVILQDSTDANCIQAVKAASAKIGDFMIRSRGIKVVELCAEFIVECSSNELVLVGLHALHGASGMYVKVPSIPEQLNTSDDTPLVPALKLDNIRPLSPSPSSQTSPNQWSNRSLGRVIAPKEIQLNPRPLRSARHIHVRNPAAPAEEREKDRERERDSTIAPEDGSGSPRRLTTPKISTLVPWKEDIVPLALHRRPHSARGTSSLVAASMQRGIEGRFEGGLESSTPPPRSARATQVRRPLSAHSIIQHSRSTYSSSSSSALKHSRHPTRPHSSRAAGIGEKKTAAPTGTATRTQRAHSPTSIMVGRPAIDQATWQTMLLASSSTDIHGMMHELHLCKARLARAQTRELLLRFLGEFLHRHRHPKTFKRQSASQCLLPERCVDGESSLLERASAVIEHSGSCMVGDCRGLVETALKYRNAKSQAGEKVRSLSALQAKSPRSVSLVLPEVVYIPSLMDSHVIGLVMGLAGLGGAGAELVECKL